MFSWSITILLGPLVKKIAVNFGMANETAIGNISAIFLLIGGVLAFGWVAFEDALARKYTATRKWLLILATLIWVIGLFLTSISQTYEALLAAQILTAIGYAAITPLAYSLAMDLTPPENRAKAFGLLDVAGSLGVGVGFLLSGILVDYTWWNVPFLVIGTFGLMLIGFMLDLSDPKKGSQERELQGSTYAFHLSRQSLGILLRKKSNVLIILANIVLYLCSGSISYYFIRMLVNDHGFSSTLAVLFFLAIFSSQAVGTIAWTRRADKKFTTKRNGKVRVLLEELAIGPIFLIIAYLLAFTLTDGVILGIFALLIILGTFFTAGLVAISFTILGETNPPELWSSVFSLNNLAQALGRGIGIAFMGFLFVNYGGIYHWGFVVVEVVSFLTLLFVFPLLSLIPRELIKVSQLLQARARGSTQ
jgi:predicted MFS family arabinose efflux permease